MQFPFHPHAVESVDTGANPSRAARLRVAVAGARAAVGMGHRRWLGLDVAVVGLCLLVIGTLWFSVVARARIERQDTLDAAVAGNDNMAATFEQYVVRSIDSADKVLQAAKREYARSGARTDLAGLLKDLGIGADEYQGIGIIDEHGNLVMTTMSGAGAVVNFSDRKHFSVHARQDTGKLFVGEPVVSRILGVMTIPLTRRINKADGSFGGVVVAQIEPARFLDFVRDATQGAGDTLSLVGLDGMTRARRVGDRRSAGEDLSANPVILQWRESAAGHFVAPGTLDGIRRLYSYRRLQDYPLVVSAGRPEAAVLAELNARHARIEAIAAAITALIGALAALLVVALHRKQRILQTLAGSEGRLSAIFNQAGVGFAVLTAEGRFLQVNQKFCDIVGYSAAEFLEQTVAGITHPDDLAATGSYIADVLDRPALAFAPDGEKRYVRKDGTSVWVAVTGSRLAETSEGPARLVAVIQDITARKEADEGLRRVARARRLMAECSRVLVHAPDEARLLKGMCDVLVGPGGYAHAWVGMALHDDAKSICPVAQAGADADHIDAALSWGDGERGQGTSGRAIRLGRAQMVADIGADPRLARWHEQARKSGFHSIVSLPLSLLDVPFGVLTILTRERNAFDTAELALLEELAGDLAYGIESLRTRVAHATSVAKLLESEERTRRNFEMGPMGMAILSPAGEWMEVNEQMCSMLEYDRAELLRTTWKSVIDPDDRDADEAALRRIRAGAGDDYSLTLRMIRRTGQECVASVAVKCVRSSDGAVRYLLVQVEDITERKRQEAALQQVSERLARQSRLFDTSLSALSDFAYTLDGQGRFLYANASLLALWKLKLDDVVGKDFFDLHYPFDQATLLHRQVREVVETKHKVVDEMRYVDPSGAAKDYEYILNPVFAPDGSVETIAGSSRDVTERKRAEDALRAAEQQQRQLAIELEAERERLIDAQAVAKVGSWETDLVTLAVTWSREVHRIFETDCSAFAPTHAKFLDFVHPDDRPQVEAAFMASASQMGTRAIEHRIVMADGRVKTVEERWHAFHDSRGQTVRALGTCQDITERKGYESRIEYLATHDALTGLPNRNLLNDRLAQAIAHAQRTGASIGVVFLDLDHFKFVNDGYGHPLGDALLKTIAERLRENVRSSDTVARLGGDEFVVLATDLADPLLGAAAVVKGVIDAFAQPFAVDGRQFSITVSAGISVYPVDGTNLDDLLKNADAAMYRAKDNGRNGYQFYATEMSHKAIARVTLEVALRQALQLDQFELHYQPLLALRTGEVTGVEALIRWRHPELGMISPAEFIPLAEETGLIVPIGDWVLRTACEQNRAWQEAGLPGLVVGVNLSALQLRQPGFVAGVERVLADSGLAARYLNLELTESMVMGTTAGVVASLERLRAMGVTLSMDDFGTGYSNLAHLTHLPIDVLKIDRSFIRGVPGHQSAASIARAIVSMGHSLGMRVVAEGVESVEQAEFLQSIWCEHAQGYLYCKPLESRACAAWIRERAAPAETPASRETPVKQAA